jgi:hypothetical protein
MIPPDRATRSGLPSCFRLASKQVLSPSPVVTFAVAGGHLGDGGAVLGGVGLAAQRGSESADTGLFRAASLQTQRAPFNAPKLADGLYHRRRAGDLLDGQLG